MPTAIRPMPDQELSQSRNAQRGAVIRGSRKPGEAECCSQELAALVEHALLERPSARKHHASVETLPRMDKSRGIARRWECCV